MVQIVCRFASQEVRSQRIHAVGVRPGPTLVSLAVESLHSLTLFLNIEADRPNAAVIRISKHSGVLDGKENEKNK